MNFSSTASFIWAVADLLRGDYRQSDYGKVIRNTRRIRILFASHHPLREVFLTAARALASP